MVTIPDLKRGERVVAAVVATHDSLTPHAIRTYLTDRLVDYQRPAEIFVLADLPRNAMGKILRGQLRDTLAGPSTS